MVEIKLTKKANLKEYRLVEGFPGIGLVGTIGASYLAEKLGMESLGYIYTDKFPPMAAIHNGVPMCPSRLYLDKENKLVVVYSDFVIPSPLVYEVANGLIDLFKRNKMSEIISLGGMTSASAVSERSIYSIVSREDLKKKLEKFGVKFIQQGVTTGVSGVLLMRAAMEGIPAFSLLVESMPGFPDPGAAALLLKKLGEYLGIKVETEMLEKEARNIHERLQKTMEQMKLGKVKYRSAEEHLPMYG